MTTLNEAMQDYRKQLEKGVLQQAYRGLMSYMAELRTHFKNNHPEFTLPGSLYFGYMDMTYFSVLPEALKPRQLKIAIVFLHEAFRFEIWLAGINKQVQAEYWKKIKESGWTQYRLVPTTQGYDAIIEHVLVANPDFDHLGELTRAIESEALEFIREVEKFVVSGEGRAWQPRI